MGKTQFCRICRTENNLKYTTKELRQLNKKQLLLARSNQQGQANNRGSKKLLLTTPTFGNICQVCDERIQIFHRLDDGGHESSSDVEIDVVNNVNESLPTRLVETLPNGEFLQRTQRPETPVIVDDDDMLFNIFMQKFDQKTQLPRNQINSLYSHQQIDKQFTNQFHTTYTPPQSTGGSEGDESKVVEILTSRESTPVPKQSVPPLTSSSNMIDPKGHRIVAIIELDDFDENEEKSADKRQSGLCTPVTSPSNDLPYTESIKHRSVLLSPSKNSSIKNPCIQETCPTTDMGDDEIIEFREVDTANEKSPTLKKRKRKVYNEKELRLVASLSLVSSDSEAEDNGSVKIQVTTNIASTVVVETFTSDEQKSLICKVCELKFPDFESLSVHERIHQGVKCTLCQIGFQQVKRLIHHMRRKHREYNGDALSEKPRSGQDSCMTIRLRYMQRTTFYECQLCGRIDEIFREHKEHIMEKHPNESKSLKDPMMKQLKCPVCKAKCGAQYLSLCRHLISSHKYQEYKSHLRELVHVSAFGWNAARQNEVAKTAKIYQFIKRKTFFFECKICRKVVAGYQHHLKHVNEHQKSVNNETKVKITILKEIPPIKSSSSKNSNLDKLSKSQQKDRVFIAKKLREKDNKSKKLVSHTNFKNSKKQIEKVIKISQKTQKPIENSVQKKNTKFKTKHMEKVKKPIKNVKSKISKSEVKIESRKNIQLKNKLIPKDKQLEKSPNSVKLTKAKSKKETSKNDSKKLKEKSAKMKDIELKQQVKKVKVKNPIRQIHLQKYQCKYCLKKCKGFRLYNLHLLRQHEENEYTKCNKCNKLYTNSSSYKEHIKQCPQLLSTSKQKRKFSEQASISDNSTESSQPCVKKVPNKSDVSVVDNLEENDLWLKDLLKLKEPLEISERSFNFHESSKNTLFTQKPINSQCCYCLHLFANDKDLKDHKKYDHLQNPDILIKYKPFKTP